jgi:hypothetical protein
MGFHAEKVDKSLFNKTAGKVSNEYFRKFIQPDAKLQIKKDRQIKGEVEYVDYGKKDQEEQFKDKVKFYMKRLTDFEDREEKRRQRLLNPDQPISDEEEPAEDVRLPVILQNNMSFLA